MSELLTSFARIKDAGADPDWFHFAQEVVLLIHGTAFRILGKSHLAEDVTQEALLKIRQRAELFRFPEGKDPEVQEACLKAWIIRISSNIAINLMRDENARHRRESTWGSQLGQRGQAECQPAIPTGDEDAELLAQMRNALHALPEPQRQPLLLRYFANLSYQQVATALGCTEQAARKRVFRSLELLRGQLRGVHGINAAVLLGLLDHLAGQPLPSPGPLSATMLNGLAASSPPVQAFRMNAKMAWLVAAVTVSLLGSGVAMLLKQRLPDPPRPVAPPAAAQVQPKPGSRFFEPYASWYKQGIYAIDRVRPHLTVAPSAPPLAPDWLHASSLQSSMQLPPLASLFAGGRLEIGNGNDRIPAAALSLLRLSDPPPIAFRLRFALEQLNPGDRKMAVRYKVLIARPHADWTQLNHDIMIATPLPEREPRRIPKTFDLNIRLEFELTALRVGVTADQYPIYECRLGHPDQPGASQHWMAGTSVSLALSGEHPFTLCDLRYSVCTVPDGLQPNP